MRLTACFIAVTYLTFILFPPHTLAMLQPVPHPMFAGVPYTDVRDHNPADNSLPTATQAKPGQAYWVQLGTSATWSPPLPKNVTTSFFYDGDGGRVKQITSAGTTKFLGQSYEIAPSGTVTKYVFAGSQRIAAKDSTGTVRFYHGDHLGSSNIISDSAGTLVELSEYTPYGSSSRREGVVNVPQKFTGQHLDVSTGLYFYNARYYDPGLGRFVSPDPLIQDPIDPQTLNRYSYVRNNPVNFVDPSGYNFWKKLFQFIAKVAATVAVAATVVGVGALLLGQPEIAVPAFAVARGAAMVAFAATTIANAIPDGRASPTTGSSGGTTLGSPGEGPGVPLSSIPLLLGTTATGELAVPGVGEVLGAAIAGILLYQGAAALRRAYEEWDRGFEIVGYHATTAASAQDIMNNGFKLSRSDLEGTNRFGPGYSLGSTPAISDAEFMKHHNGMMAPGMLQVTARLTRNVPLPHFLTA